MVRLRYTIAEKIFSHSYKNLVTLARGSFLRLLDSIV